MTQVFVLAASDLPFAREFVARFAPSAWAGFCRDAPINLGLAQHFAGAAPLPAAAILSEAAASLRRPFLDMDDQLDIPDSVAWQASSTAEKSPLSSPLFHDLATLKSIFRLVRDQGCNERLIVVVDDALTAACCQAMLAGAGWLAPDAPKYVLPDEADLKHLWLTTARRLPGYIKEVARRKAIVTRLRAEFDCPLTLPPRLDALLATWGGQGCFDKAELHNQDRYFGGLPGLLRSRGLQIGWLVTPMDWTAPFAELAREAVSASRAGELVVLPQETAPIGKLTLLANRCANPQAYPQPQRLDLSTPDCPALAGAWLGRMFRVRLAEDIARGVFVNQLQYGFVGEFLARRKVVVDRFLFPYENQPLEKMLRLGFRQASPATVLIGSVHAPTSRFWLSSFPGRQDVAQGDIPDYLAVPGRFWRELFAAEGFPEARLLDWPAWRSLDLAPTDRAANAPRTAVACCLPIDSDEAVDTLSLTLAAASARPSLTFSVKAHPAMGDDRVLATVVNVALSLAGLSAVPPNVTFFTVPIAVLLARHGILLTAGSSVEYEGAVSGVVTIFLQSRCHVDLNTLPLEEHAGAARSPAELVRLLDQVTSGRLTAKSPWSAEKVHYFFSPFEQGANIALLPAESTSCPPLPEDAGVPLQPEGP